MNHTGKYIRILVLYIQPLKFQFSEVSVSANGIMISANLHVVNCHFTVIQTAATSTNLEVLLS